MYVTVVNCYTEVCIVAYCNQDSVAHRAAEVSECMDLGIQSQAFGAGTNPSLVVIGEYTFIIN